MGLALAHADQPPLHDVERGRFPVDQAQPQPILRRRQRTVLVSRVPAGGARLAIEAPLGHRAMERGLKGGTTRGNSSTVRLVKTRTSGGRGRSSVHRTLPLVVASLRRRHRIPYIGMNSIVKRNVLCEPAHLLSWRLVIFQIACLRLSGPPQTLDTDVVQRPSSPIQADLSPRSLQAARTLGTGNLRPLVPMKDRRVHDSQGLLQGVETRAHVHRHGHGP